MAQKLALLALPTLIQICVWGKHSTPQHSALPCCLENQGQGSFCPGIFHHSKGKMLEGETKHTEHALCRWTWAWVEGKSFPTDKANKGNNRKLMVFQPLRATVLWADQDIFSHLQFCGHKASTWTPRMQRFIILSFHWLFVIVWHAQALACVETNNRH